MISTSRVDPEISRNFDMHTAAYLGPLERSQTAAQVSLTEPPSPKATGQVIAEADRASRTLSHMLASILVIFSSSSGSSLAAPRETELLDSSSASTAAFTRSFSPSTRPLVILQLYVVTVLTFL